MRLNRRSFCGSLVGGALAAKAARADEAILVTDMAGRTVRLPAPPKRIVLLEARDIVSMALLHPDPAALVVGWAATDRIDSKLLQERFTQGRDIALVGKQSPDTISIEGLASLSPDLVVANFYMAPHGSDDLLVTRLESFGIPVIFSDTSSNTVAGETLDDDPVANIIGHMQMWGAVLGVADRVRDYAGFFETHMQRVQRCVAGAPTVTTYLEIQSTAEDCCWAAGNKVWGSLLEHAGGKNLPGVTEPWFQKLQLEHLLSTPHAVYIASGGGWASDIRPAIGPGLDPVKGREGLERIIRRTGFDLLPSVREGRVHGIWTGLISVPPLNILFIELAAKWLHPDLCAEIDPAATLAEINARFLSTPIEGPLWVSLQEA